ncbi:MAG: TPM domain-containing protein [Caulobacteraceae bacterium]|nr:TPM domain-containing protein [Caulobacteraceae bacterium]
MIRLARGILAGLGLAAALLAFAPAATAAAPTFPPLTGRVVDDAAVLSPQTKADLTAELAALQQKNGDQLIVVTLPSLQGYEIEDYGYQLGRAWGIGQKGKDNGALFIVAPSEHKVRIEVGYGLEPVLTDALSSVILQTAVLPKFRAGDVDGGVKAGTDAIVQQLGLDPQAAQANVQAAEQQAQTEPAAPHARVPLGLIILVVVFILPILLGRGGGGLWALPFLFMGGGGFGGGGFRDRDDGFGGGGDFGGGGGGSFGGGGASGSW